MVQIVLTGVKDPQSKVRGAGIFAVGQLAEHCQPEVGQQAREILPAVFAVVNDPDPEVQDQANYALQSFCETLGKIIAPWNVNNLMRSPNLIYPVFYRRYIQKFNVISIPCQFHALRLICDTLGVPNPFASMQQSAA
jgi:hypothetical protein